MKVCFSCRKALEISGKPGRGDECPHCGADLKCCLNCRFFDSSAYNECAEPQADRVLDKDRSNYCEYFEFRESTGEGGGGNESMGKTAEEKAKEELKKLFGD